MNVSYFSLLQHLSNNFKEIIDNETEIIKKLSILLKLSPVKYKNLINKGLGGSLQKYNMLSLLGALIENIIEQMRIENAVISTSKHTISNSSDKKQSTSLVSKKGTSFCTRKRYDMWGKRRPKTYQEILTNRIKYALGQNEKLRNVKSENDKDNNLKEVTASYDSIRTESKWICLKSKKCQTKGSDEEAKKFLKSLLDNSKSVSALTKEQESYKNRNNDTDGVFSTTSVKFIHSDDKWPKSRSKGQIKKKVPATAIITIPIKSVNRPINTIGEISREYKYRTQLKKKNQKISSVQTSSKDFLPKENSSSEIRQDRCLRMKPNASINLRANMKSLFTSSAAFKALMKQERINSEMYLKSKEMNTQTEKFDYSQELNKNLADKRRHENEKYMKLIEDQRRENYFHFARMITNYINVRNNLKHINNPLSISGEQAKKNLNSLWFCKKSLRQRPIETKQNKPELSRSAASLLNSIENHNIPLNYRKPPRYRSRSKKRGKHSKKYDLLKNIYSRLFSPINAEYPRKDTKGIKNSSKLEEYAQTSTKDLPQVQNSYLYRLTYGDKMSESLKYLFGSVP